MATSGYTKRTIHKVTLTSEALGTERSLRILVPPGYDESFDYPVIYCQDGEQFFNFGRIATYALALMAEEKVEPFLVVGVDVDLKQRTAEYAADGERFAQYVRFFNAEMLPYVEQQYAVRNVPKHRILAGDSLGATVSLHLALDRPDLYANVLSLSGAFLNPTQNRIEYAVDLSWLNIYMLIGTEEHEVETTRGTFDFLEANRTTHRLLKSRGAKMHYLEKPGKHIWGFWQQELPAALRYFMWTYS